MGKSVHNDVLDAALGVIASADAIAICTQEPTTRTEALTTYKLATTSMSPGDFSIGDGDVSGRKVQMAEKADITIDDSGTATHVALVDGTRLLYVTTCTEQELTAANAVTVPTWKVEIRDPS